MRPQADAQAADAAAGLKPVFVFTYIIRQTQLTQLFARPLQADAQAADAAAGLKPVDMLERSVQALGLCRKECFDKMERLSGERKKLVVFRCGAGFPLSQQ